MAVKQLELGARARADLAGIWAFSKERWDGQQAERYADQLDAAMRGLASGERLGHLAIIAGYWSLTVEAHIIYYEMSDALVRVVRVLHGKQEPARALSGRL